ncbi:MAG TPA: winged helix-turn-helix domain-containing protein [Solirubrobacteraceae bacterium]|nr:winged helix-turn-helix domain-containing protein [Solirubrobacteraceae bacterium]
MAQSNPETEIDGLEDPRYAKALAHPLRVRILAMLDERDSSPVQLAEHLDASLGTVAYHVRTLERLGLIEMVATHQRRGATEHVYAAREHPRFSSRAWSNADPKVRDMMIASALSQVGEYAAKSAAAGGFDHQEASVSRHAVAVDSEGFGELAEATRRWQEEITKIEREAAARLSANGERPIDAGVVLLMFEATSFFTDGDHGNGHKRGSSRD